MNPTRVVNIRRSVFDVYIGRAGQGHDGYFGNPVSVGRRCCVCSQVHDERLDVIDCFEVYARQRVANDPVFRERVRGLRGKILGCFCKPQACHGDVLAQIAEELQGA